MLNADIRLTHVRLIPHNDAGARANMLLTAITLNSWFSPDIMPIIFVPFKQITLIPYGIQCNFRANNIHEKISPF